MPFLTKINLESVGSLTTKLLSVLSVLSADMMPCSRLAIHLIQFEKYDESKTLLSYFRRIEKSTTSFWCRDCLKEVELSVKEEHEDYHFAMSLVEKPVESKAEEFDRLFAQSIQDSDESELKPKPKKLKITDYFTKK